MWEQVNFETDDVASSAIGPFFEHAGVCTCHSSYITALDWSSNYNYVRDENGEWIRTLAKEHSRPLVIQSTCGAYETIYYQPAPTRTERVLGSHVAMPSGVTWPVAKIIRRDQRDTNWNTWSCTLGFPVMGIWQRGMDGTDVNACDRSPLLRDMTYKQLYGESNGPAEGSEKFGTPKRGKVMVTANDDGTVGLYNFPSILHHSPHHSFRGHASHVTNIRFLSDASRVISSGGMDRTTFQWKTHGIVAPSERFKSTTLEGKASRAAKHQVRKDKQQARQSLRKSRDAAYHAQPRLKANPKTTRKPARIRQKEEEIARLKAEELRKMLEIQQLELEQKRHGKQFAADS